MLLASIKSSGSHEASPQEEIVIVRRSIGLQNEGNSTFADAL
jgi:hypothetical protein